MDKEKFNQIRTIIVTGIGIIVAYGAARHSWLLPSLAILGGGMALYISRKKVSEVVHDERTAIIQQKASSRTLGYITALTALVGIILVELSYRGFTEYRLVGYAFAYQAFIMLGLQGLFTWYYRRQMGG
jgi:uncharacterized membrane protein